MQYDTTNEWILYHILQAINRRVARQARIGPFHQGICSCQQIRISGQHITYEQVVFVRITLFVNVCVCIKHICQTFVCKTTDWSLSQEH